MPVLKYVHTQTHGFVWVWVNQCELCQLSQCTCSGSRTWPLSQTPRVRSSSRSRATETFLRSETVSSTYSREKQPPLFFLEALVLPAAWRIGPSTWLWEVWHPVLYANRLFMGRMLCPSELWVNTAIMWSKSWHQSGEESCLFPHCFWSGWYDWRQTSHLLVSHTTREKQELMMSRCVPDSY